MKYKISYKLISLILLISFIVTSISIYIQINNQYKNEILAFEKSLDNIKTNQVPILAQSLWNVDYMSVNIFLNNLIKSEKIIYASIIENSGNIISAGKTKEEDIIKKEFIINKNIDSQKYPIGKLIVVAELTPLYENLQNNAIGIIFTEIIKMLLISLSIIFVIKKLLINPLEKMALYANELSLKNLNKPLCIQDSNKDNFSELAIVSEAINTMRINLIGQIKESQEKNKIMAQQAKLAAMGEMIVNIAHQWKQPLSLITTTASAIQINSELGQLQKKQVTYYTDEIMNAANYLASTINDFSDFFKPNKNKEFFKIKNCFQKTFKLLNTQLTNNNVSIIKNIKEIEIYGFENELIQVLINILNNAKDEFLKNSQKKNLVFIDVFSKDKEVYISIKDNAGGIKETSMDRIFEPYFSTKHQSQGTGIGLYMSEVIIVKHMQGKLSAKNVEYTYENEVYTGAQFNIIINKEGKKNEKM